MKKALSVMETALIAVVVCIVAIGGFTAYNKIKIKLAGLSATETTGTLAVIPDNGGSGDGDEIPTDPKTGKIDITNCEKISKISKLCNVRPCRGESNPACVMIPIEVAGTVGNIKWLEVPLSEKTSMKVNSLDDCIGQSAGITCYDQHGNKVKCNSDNTYDIYDENGNLVKGHVKPRPIEQPGQEGSTILY